MYVRRIVIPPVQADYNSKESANLRHDYSLLVVLRKDRDKILSLQINRFSFRYLEYA